jgi:predicted Zn-dependent protease
MISLSVEPRTIPIDPVKIHSHLAASTDRWLGVRFVEEKTHHRSYKNGKPAQQFVQIDRGVMIEVFHQGHFGYCGTSDLTLPGIESAFRTALARTEALAKYSLSSFPLQVRPKSVGSYTSPLFQSVDATSLQSLSSLLQKASMKLKGPEEIVAGRASIRLVETQQIYVNSSGSQIDQNYVMITTDFNSTAQKGSESQYRSDKGGARCLQIGLEVLDEKEILHRCEKIASEAVQLLYADNCPSDTRDLLLSPDHMMIQIHESIGHPLEIDRILGDERNYAGWSFVQPEDFGKLQYGANLMNVTFDPSMPGEFASYAFDECGNPAKKEFLIKEGRLLRGLGSLESQTRSGLDGVANFRAASWNRAPIDRMANINLEPGTSSFEEMVSQTEKGLYVQANTSWSIDDYRNKFQFGAEYGQLIENGKLTKVVKNPNYRGVTIPFWKSLKAVGNGQELELYGSPFCGKGEPNQVIRVGHAAPPCLFSQVEVFGGGQ